MQLLDHAQAEIAFIPKSCCPVRIDSAKKEIQIAVVENWIPVKGWHRCCMPRSWNEAASVKRGISFQKERAAVRM